MGKTGITELHWKNMGADKQFYWKLISRGIAIVASLFVVKTGVGLVDKTISVFTALLPMLITESQRSHSKFSPNLARKLDRTCINMATYGLVTLGLSYFFIQMLNGAAHAYMSLGPRSGNELVEIVKLLIWIAVVPIAARRVFRNLQYWSFIYAVPRRQLVKLLIGRRHQINDDVGFVIFEGWVIFACYMYGAMLSACLMPFIELYKLLLK